MNNLKNNIKQTAIVLLALLSFTPTFKTKAKTAKAIIKTHFNAPSKNET
ncbi:MAG: hypothetical protein IPI22_09075 [Bacteroidetes bacterium]|nr:hypothetical protein [Bacteroidota bacterium]